ncbi:hypothetical protein O6H91_09G010000 [Diphasiastrum complanatum]|uniref:Uncharacterized protein n=1 Tax=Diphasiastrum complanatum TaxID=34168 RepID=A0ACC2CLC6_DIPCM|nr:hypothetical protein O6H91_09G010000 [Diphasiastrum complanatum]
MGSRIKEDEKHEKIIRGLAKREENRRCINCGALGPQYVCTNFSIFVCTNCSGVHREFTHRVKSISMAKFTAAEVDALQAGGNQRGREIFFKNWDSHRHTLPDSSYPDKVREFIKAVYVDRRYIGDKPPQRGKQGDREDIPNYRKSDYRSDSYPESQSPSYEYRFENNRYGNRPLSRGSDGGRYEDRGLHYDDTRSPGRYGPGRGRHDRSDRDRRFEDRFANDGLKSPGRFEYDRSRLDRSPYSDGDRRFEDRFANEARDPRRTNERPPTYPDYGSESSPPVRSVREILGDDIPALRIEDNIHTNGRIEDAKGLRSQAQPRKDLHTSSFGSSDNGASTAGSDLSLKRDNSGSLIDFGADSDIPAETVRSDPFGVTSLQPPAQCSSTGWALFDVNPGSEQKVETVPGLGAPLEAADPFRASKSGVEGLTTLATPMLDSWPSSLQQWTSVNPAMANRPSDQNLVVPGQAGVQLAQKGPAPVAAAAASVPAQNQESKPQNNQRSEIPEDLFTPSFLNMGMQLGHQFPLGGPSFMPLGSALPGVYVQGGFQGYGQRPKSKNPFDLPEETAQVPASAFPNMAVLQTALPNAPLPPFSNPGIRSAAPQWSQTAPVNQQPASFPSAGLPVGSGFFNQQPSTFMPPLLQQYSFTPAPSPDQFTGYQHGPQMFVPASGFGVPQSSTRPIGGNPFD